MAATRLLHQARTATALSVCLEIMACLQIATVATAAAAGSRAAAGSPAPALPMDPYPAVHGGRTSGPAVAASPDPMSNYEWDLASLPDPFAYQSLVDYAVSAAAEPAASFSGVSTLTAEI